MKNNYSIIIPAYNEEGAISALLQELVHGELKHSSEVIVVNDHSSDKTAEIAKTFPVTVISNVQNFGYGYSLKRGITAAKYDHIIILDADGSYPVASLSTLIHTYEKGFDMVVGARHGVYYRGSLTKRLARFFFRILSEFATGRKIPDINSGCRVFRKDAAIRFFNTLSSGFSFTTTITLAFMLNAYSVHYLPIEYHKRSGKSKVRYVRDTIRSAQIIVEAIVLYNPIKIYMLMAIGIILSGILSIILAYYLPLLALFVFFTLAFTITVLSLGFVAVFLKFMPTGKL